MGRPRKRQFIESTIDEPTATPTQQNENFQDSYAVPLVDDFSGYNDSYIPEPYFTDIDPLQLPMEPQNLEASSSSWLPTMNDGQLSWRFGIRDSTAIHPIDFSDIDVSLGTNGMVSVDREPQSSTSPDPSSTNSNGLLENSTGTCSCLASMYLSLAALQQFPSDITKALQVVRAAAATAGKSIWVRIFLKTLRCDLTWNFLLQCKCTGGALNFGPTFEFQIWRLSFFSNRKRHQIV
jgi:hypothetical protein